MYRLYLDEVGTDGLTCLDQDKHRYLSLTGVAVQRNHARDLLEPRLNRLKAEFFDHDPDDPLVFHRVEMLGGKGTFQRLRSDSNFRTAFDAELHSLFVDCEYAVITALIDKKWMTGQVHWRNKHPYHFLMEVIVEKYAQFLERKGDIGDVMPESRQAADKFLQGEFLRVWEGGTKFVPAKRIQSVLRGSKLKFRTKKDNIAGLQLCDLVAHPSHMLVRQFMGHDVNLGPFTTELSKALTEKKYDRCPYSGTIKGYGYKHMP